MEQLWAALQEELKHEAGDGGPAQGGVLAKGVGVEVPAIRGVLFERFIQDWCYQGVGSVMVSRSEIAMDNRTVLVAVVILGLMKESYSIGR